MPKQHKKIVVLGAPGSCKGFWKKCLTAEFGTSFAAVSLGKMTTDRLANEPDFYQKYFEMVKHGDLLPDEEAIPMARREYGNVLSKLDACNHYFDGVFRTGPQTDAFLHEGILTPDDTLVVVANASYETCWQRVEHRATEKTDGERIDNASFPNRFAKYELHRSAVINSLRGAGIRTLFVDANPDLETVVIPKLMILAREYWKPHGSGARSVAPTDTLHPLPSGLVNMSVSRARVLRSHFRRELTAA